MQKKLKRMIDSADVVSFDIFDTLIRRIVSRPKDIAYMIQEIFNKNNNEPISNFHKIRINSEMLARQHSEKEITIDDIYNEIQKQLNMSYDKIEYLKKLELELEKEVCYLKKEAKDVIEYCNKNKKRVIITSDMYLKSDFLKEILVKTNLNYEEIFVSSESGFKKSNGTLFKYIIKKLNLNPKKIVHIGDNFKSDYIQAKISGIKSYWCKNKTKKQENNYHEYILKGYIEELFEKYKNYNKYFEFGYKKLGILMYGFCNYIINSAKENNADKIIFLAREGKFIKECYELLKKNNVPIDYLYVSRKSISSSIIKECNDNDIEKIINLQSLALNETTEMFLKRFNLLNEKNLKLLEEENIKLKSNFYNESKKIKVLFKKLINNSIQKEDLFKKYLKQFNITNKTMIVDIGWNGTMQDLIQKELDCENININGYYLGVRNKRKNQFKHGYLFDGDDEDMEICSRSMVAFLEILFSSNHGTTLGYKYNKGIEPILDKLEIEKEQMNQITQIQLGAKKFIEDYKGTYICRNINFEDIIYSEALLKIGTNPSKNEINLFKDFMIFNEKSKKLIGGNLFIFYIFHPRKFKDDFLDSGWKIAFLKNILKINLPYKKIYKAIYRTKK